MKERVVDAKEFAEVRARCLPMVTKWRWATDEVFALQPYWFERSRRKPGRWLNAEPKDRAGKYEYGLDSEGRIVVERYWLANRGYHRVKPYVDMETVWEYGANEVVGHTWVGRRHDGVRYLPAFGVFSSQRLDHGRPLTYEQYRARGERIVSYWREQYTYDKERLARVDAEKRPSVDEPSSRWREQYSYNNAGQLEMIRFFQTNGVFVRYYRPPDGVSVEGLGTEIEVMLLEQIPKLIAKARIGDAVYSLVLSYHIEGTQPLPPFLGVGLEEERLRWGALARERLRLTIWNPAEYRTYKEERFKWEDREVEEKCGMLNAMLAVNERWGPVKALLNRVAAKLMNYDWRGKLNVTPDFVVYAVDEECGDLRANMKASIPAPLLAEFKKKGWL